MIVRGNICRGFFVVVVAMFVIFLEPPIQYPANILNAYVPCPPKCRMKMWTVRIYDTANQLDFIKQ